MTVIIIPRKRLTQPQPQGRVAVAPEWSDGIVALQNGREMVVGGATSTGSPGQEVVSRGIGWRGGSGKYFFGAAEYKPTLNNPYSLAFEIVSRTVVDGGAVFSIADAPTSGTVRLLFRCAYPRKFDVYWNGSYRIQAGAEWQENERTLCVFSHDGTTARLWINGVLAGSAAGEFGSESNATNWYFGSGYDKQFDAVYLWHAQWSRALSTSEALSISDNPWQLFRADPIRIYSLPSGPIGISWSSLTASNITQTGAALTLGGITR